MDAVKDLRPDELTEIRLRCLEDRLNIIMLELHDLKNTVEDTIDIQHNKIKIPHRCPICNGKTMDEKDEVCVPCLGNGIVWG